MTFCVSMSLHYRTNTIEFQGYRSKLSVTRPDFRILYHCEIGQKTFVDTITHEQLHEILREHVSWQPLEPC